MQIIACEGQLTTTGQSPQTQCSGSWVVVDYSSNPLDSWVWNQELFDMGFEKTLTFWAIGLAAGLIIGMIRKAK